MKITKKKHNIWSISVNTSKTLFAVGTEKGFKVFSTLKIQEIFSADFKEGISLVEFHDYSNIFVLRKGPNDPTQISTVITVWDASTKKTIVEMELEMRVGQVKLTKDYIVISATTRTYLYKLTETGIELINEIETHKNLQGAFDLKVVEDYTFFAVPLNLKQKMLPDQGVVAVSTLEVEGSLTMLRTFKEMVDFLKFDKEAKRLIAYNHKHYLIRIFEISTGFLLKSLKRQHSGMVTSLSYSPNNHFLLVCDENSDCEIYNTGGMQGDDEKQLNLNRTSVFSFLSSIITYFGNEWSFAYARTPAGTPGKAYFSSDSEFSMISESGVYQHFSFDTLYGGECFLEERIEDFVQEFNAEKGEFGKASGKASRKVSVNLREKKESASASKKEKVKTEEMEDLD
jgi:WD40 repeat protein